MPSNAPVTETLRRRAAIAASLLLVTTFAQARPRRFPGVRRGDDAVSRSAEPPAARTRREKPIEAPPVEAPPPSPPRVEEPNELPPGSRAATSGLAVQAALGLPYGIFGTQAAYYFQLDEAFARVAPYAGIGIGAIRQSGDSRDAAFVWPIGSAIGVMGSLGLQHRFVLDMLYGMISGYSLSLHGEAEQVATLWGAAVLVGYEYMAHSGVHIRTSLGVEYTLSAPLLTTRERIRPTGTLIAVGYKFW